MLLFFSAAVCAGTLFRQASRESLITRKKLRFYTFDAALIYVNCVRFQYDANPLKGGNFGRRTMNYRAGVDREAGQQPTAQ